MWGKILKKKFTSLLTTLCASDHVLQENSCHSLGRCKNDQQRCRHFHKKKSGELSASGAKCINRTEVWYQSITLYNPLLKLTALPSPRIRNKFHSNCRELDHLWSCHQTMTKVKAILYEIWPEMKNCIFYFFSSYNYEITQVITMFLSLQYIHIGCFA